MESITIGYNLAISPVFILEEFEKDTAIIGAMLAAGAATGTLVSILLSLTPWGGKFMNKYLPSPFNVYISLGGISVSVFLAAVPSFPVHLIGLLFLMGFNDLAALILNALQGSITSENAYSIIGPFGQIVRRSLNVVAAMSGPLLFGVWPRLPYILAGSITFVWTIILAIVISYRMKSNKKRISMAASNKLVGKDAEATSSSFILSEIMARSVKKLAAISDINDTSERPQTETEKDSDSTEQ